MNESTRLLRQIHPHFVQADGTVMSQAFNPSKNHQFQLSVYDGDQIDEQAAWEHFTRNPAVQSAGVMAVTGAECDSENLAYRPDPEPFPEHALIDFYRFAESEEQLTNNDRKRKAMKLRDKAVRRGWLLQAPDPPQD